MTNLFRQPTDWSWILRQHHLNCSFDEYNISTHSAWLCAIISFDIRAITNPLPIRSRVRLVQFPFVTHRLRLHILRAGHILTGCRKSQRFVLQGTVLVIEWSHAITPTANAGDGWFDAIGFLQQLPHFTARIMIRGSTNHKPRG
ncbi:hypothetical protein OC861_006849, partial [Tilletia horrida]